MALQGHQSHPLPGKALIELQHDTALNRTPLLYIVDISIGENADQTRCYTIYISLSHLSRTNSCYEYGIFHFCCEFLLKMASEMHVARQIVVHCCSLLSIYTPLFSIVVLCYPFLSIVIHCYSLLSIVVIHCRYHRLPLDGAVIGTF